MSFSVKEISVECLRLEELAGELVNHRIDVYRSVSNMLNLSEEMVSAFDIEVHDEQEVSRLKAEVERAAIFVEYTISPYNRQLKRRYASRVLVQTYFRRVSELTTLMVSKKMLEPVKLKRVLAAYKFLSESSEKALHILFKWSKEDEAYVKEIDGLIKEIEEELL